MNYTLYISTDQLHNTMRLNLLVLPFLLYALPSFAEQSIYCPQHQGYIKIGMTETQILSACGEPLSKQTSRVRATEKVPVQQLIYTTLQIDSPSDWGGNPMDWGGTNNLFQQWSLPSGSKGITAQINIMNQKVVNITLDGSDSNAMSICDGGSFQVGDPESKVYQACGSPNVVNQTFVEQRIPSNQKPEIWIYQFDPYQAPISLTIVNGKLQSIN